MTPSCSSFHCPNLRGDNSPVIRFGFFARNRSSGHLPALKSFWGWKADLVEGLGGMLEDKAAIDMVIHLGGLMFVSWAVE
jgi:hypothetical protein